MSGGNWLLRCALGLGGAPEGGGCVNDTDQRGAGRWHGVWLWLLVGDQRLRRVVVSAARARRVEAAGVGTPQAMSSKAV